MEVLNFVGLSCPMPVIKLKKFLSQNGDNDFVVELLISDKSGKKDIPAFCQQQGIQVEMLSEDEIIKFKLWR